MIARNHIHLFALAVINHWIFEYSTILVILTNSIFLALEDPTSTGQSAFFKISDDIFLACYTVEMIFKILGMGFLCNKGAYLRDSWNLLDFVIVFSAYFTLFAGGGADLAVLRSFRVLRPLRTISSVEGLKIMMSALLSALPLLRDTIIILVFFFIIFAIAGV